MTIAWYAQVTDANRTKQIRFNTAVIAEQVAVRMEMAVAARLAVARQIRYRWQSAVTADERVFAKDVQVFHETYLDFQAINKVDRHGVIQWVTPGVGNQKAIGINLMVHPMAGPIIKDALQSDSLRVTPPLMLAQGGAGIAAYLPLKRDGAQAGFVNLVFRIDPLIDAVLGVSTQKEFVVQLSDGANDIFSNGAVRRDNPFAVQREFSVANRTWLLQLRLTAASARAMAPPISKLVIMTALLIAAGMAGLMHLYLGRRSEATEQSKLLENTFDNIDHGIAILDAQQSLAAYNKRFLDIMGVAYDQVRPGDPLTKVLSIVAERGEYGNGDLDELLRQRLSLSDTGALATFERTRRNGDTIEVRSRPIADGDHVVSVTDITQRKRAEAELRKSEERYRDIVEGTEDLVAIADCAGKLVFVNSKVEYFLGRSGEETLGHSVYEFVHPDDRTKSVRAFRLWVRAGTSSARFENRIVSRDGTVRHMAWTLQMRRKSTGKISTISGFGRDITQRKMVAVQLHAAKEEAELANHAKTMFLANMSHDLRTPLNAIIGFAEIMQYETFGSVGSAKNREYLADIANSGRDLMHLISDILDVSKIEAGELSIDSRPIDLGDVAGACLRLVVHTAKDRGIDLQSDLPETLPQLLGDELRLKQILINLLSNSIKFTPAKGRVTLGAYLRDDASVVLFVRDTGVGIDPSVALRVFEPFVTHADNPALARKGTGLGLYLVKCLAKLHGGTIEIDSKPDEGTHVKVLFPPERTIMATPANET